MTLVLVTPPAVEPITLDEARLHLRLDGVGSPDAHDDDTLVSGLIAAVRQQLEQTLGRALCTQTWDLMLDRFPCMGHDAPIKLPRPPLQQVDFVDYLDTDGVWQRLSPSLYQVTGASGFAPAKLRPAWNQSWPSTRDQSEAVRVRFTAGYLDNSSPGDTQEGVPGPIKTAIKQSLAAFYQNRGDKSVTLPEQAVALVAPYRVGMFG